MNNTQGLIINENRLKTYNIYSNKEQIIGYTDDNKPVYRMILSIPTTDGTGWKSVKHNLNIGKIYNATYTLLFNNQFYPLPCDIILEIKISSTNFDYYMDNQYVSTKGIVEAVIEYTKL